MVETRKPYAPVLAGLVVLKLILNHADHDVVADKTSSIHDLLCLEAELGLLRYLVSEHVASGQMADAELVADPGCLCALSCTWIYTHCVSDEWSIPS